MKFTHKIGAILALILGFSFSANSQAAEPYTLDLMVLYTNALVNSQYGSDIDARMAYLEDYTTQSMVNSHINAKVRIVHSARINKKYDVLLGGAQLAQLQSDSEVAALRQKHGADFVVLVGDMNGYCGYGYVTAGNATTGKLYSNSSSYAFSLVDYACGAATFAHELGHNMSLGHSVAQNSTGGIWEWARGHGESGRFITTMAYGSAYNSYNRLQYYSTPELLHECEGSSCGIVDSADSTRNINLLASQLADFMPTVYDDGSTSTTNNTAVANCNSDEKEAFCVEYYNNNTLDGSPVYTETVAVIDNDWLGTAPSGSLNNDNFSIRWQGQFNFADDSYEFKANADDGIRVWVDNQLIIDDWSNPSSGEKTATIALSGEVPIVVEYYEATGNAFAKLNWKVIENNNTGTTNVCNKTYLENNLLQEGDFNSLTPWDTYFNRAELAQFTEQKACGLDNILHIKNRTRYYGGVSQDITSVIQPGVDYKFSVKVKLGSTSRQNLYAALAINNNSSIKFQPLGKVSITDSEYTTLESNFVLQNTGDIGRVDVVIYGPAEGIDILMDEMLLTPVTNDNTGTNGTTSTETVVLSNDFVNGLQGWNSAFSALLSHDTSDGVNGQGSLKVANRNNWYSGTWHDVKGLLVDNKTYVLEADVLLSGNVSKSFKTYLYRVDGTSSHWVKLVPSTIAAGTWQQLKVDITVPEVNSAKTLRLYLFGPEAGVDFKLDNIRITEE